MRRKAHINTRSALLRRCFRASTTHANENEAGQSLVIVALLLIALAGMLGLAIDGGRAFGARRQSQNASDAAALAAVRVLAVNRATATESDIFNVATNLARSNDVTVTNVTATFIDEFANDLCTMNLNCGSIPGNATGVRVITTLQLDPYFINVLIGNTQIPVRTVAAAQSGRPAPTELMPMVVPCENLDGQCHNPYSTMVTIKGDTQSAGSVQWLDYGVTGCGLTEYLELKPGCVSGEIGLDPDNDYYNSTTPTMWNKDPPVPPAPSPWKKTSTGQVAAVASALDCWLDNPPKSGCWQYHPIPSSRNWLVPIANHNNGQTGNNLWYHMVNLGEFEFYGYYFSNGSCNWYGKQAGQGCSYSDLSLYAPELVSCAVDNVKCVEGKFNQIADVPIHPAVCVLAGGNVCAIGMSE